MTTQQPRKISLGNDLGPVLVEANGAQVVIEADGQFHSANETSAKSSTTPEIGDEMEDGTIYAGISPDTHKPMFAKPKDESGLFSFNQAAAHAKNIGDGFHVPTINELNVLYENRNKGKLKGTFNETGSIPAGWYWSSAPNGNDGVWAQRFNDGFQSNYDRGLDSSLRLAR